MSERDKDLALADMSMLIRMMVTKHRRGKLDEEYCLKALDYLQRKGLQGNILRATEPQTVLDATKMCWPGSEPLA